MNRYLFPILLVSGVLSMTGFPQTYSTRFARTESPLSEAGRWTNNGVEKARVKDDTFKTGNPGIGEFLACEAGRGVGSNSDFGFSAFTARGLGESKGSPSEPK
ncbi:MAG: hypothetical protein ACLQVX_25760 [Limisphaerales bacterium]